MRPSAESYPCATRGTVKPTPALGLWFGFVRLVACLVAVFVFSLFVAPGEVQAHGVHGSTGVTASVAATDGATTVGALGGFEVSTPDCVTCCASSSCAAVSIPETFDLLDAEAATGGFQAACTVDVRQMTQHGLRRPPRLNS